MVPRRFFQCSTLYHPIDRFGGYNGLYGFRPSCALNYFNTLRDNLVIFDRDEAEDQ